MTRCLSSLLFLVAVAAAPRFASASDSGKVEIENLHIVLERKKDRANAIQSLRLVRASGGGSDAPADFVIPLPEGARWIDASAEDADVEMLSDRAIFKGRISETGADLTLQYDLPIINGSAKLVQNLNTRIQNASAISTWTVGGAGLSGTGFSRSAMHQLSNGIEALVVSAKDISGDPLVLTLSGLSRWPGSAERWTAFVLSVLMMTAGFAAWFRRKFSVKGREYAPEDL